MFNSFNFSTFNYLLYRYINMVIKYIYIYTCGGWGKKEQRNNNCEWQQWIQNVFYYTKKDLGIPGKSNKVEKN